MIAGQELTIPEAAEAMQLSEPDLRRLLQRGYLHARQVSGREVIAADEIRRYWYATAVEESEAVEARMNAEDARLGRQAEEDTLNRGLRSVTFIGRPPGCAAALLILVMLAIVGFRQLGTGTGSRAGRAREFRT